MRIFYMILLVIILCGCNQEEAVGRPDRVVIGITVTASVDGKHIHRHYREEPSIRAVLYYLRSLDPQIITNMEPDSYRTNAYRIILEMSDGSEVIYHQLHNDFLQKNGEAWKTIDPVAGASLPKLLAKLPDDSA